MAIKRLKAGIAVEQIGLKRWVIVRVDGFRVARIPLTKNLASLLARESIVVLHPTAKL